MDLIRFNCGFPCEVVVYVKYPSAMFSGVGSKLGTLMCPLEVRWIIRAVCPVNLQLQKLQVSSVEGGGGVGCVDCCCITIGDGVIITFSVELPSSTFGLGSVSSVIGFGRS